MAIEHRKFHEPQATARHTVDDRGPLADAASDDADTLLLPRASLDLDPPAPVEVVAGPSWKGELTYVPYSVGDPGRAAAVPARPDPDTWDRRDTVLDGLVLPDEDGKIALALRAASTRGRSHRASGTVRQDAYGYRCTPDRRYLVATVADGVGSGRLSHFAAEVVARAGSHAIATQLETVHPNNLDWRAVLDGLAADIVGVARRRLRATVPDVDGMSVKDVSQYMAATALFAVVDLLPVDRQHYVHTLAVGDTAAWVLRDGSRWEPRQPVKNDGAAIASSSTNALPRVPSAVAPASPTRLGPTDALVLITDGIGDPLADGRGSVGAFLAEKWRQPPAALEFAAQVDFARKSHDDDRTAVVVWPVARP